MKIQPVGLTGGVAHYTRYFCIERCRFYFSSCTYVPGEVLRQCSAANPADIYVPSMTVLGLKKSHFIFHARIDTAVCTPMRILVNATALGLAYPAARGIGAIGNGTEA